MGNTKHLENYFASIRGTELLLHMANMPNSGQFIVYSNETQPEANADYEFAHAVLPQAKIFEVGKTVMNLLCNTDSPVMPSRLPFNPMFIECRLEYDNVWMPSGSVLKKQKYLGFLLVESLTPLSATTKIGQLSHLVKYGNELLEEKYPNIFIMAVTEDETGIGHIKISLYKEWTEGGVQLQTQWTAERDFIRNFVMGFLNFLNDPEVEIVDTLRSNKSVRKAIAKHKKLDFIQESKVVRVTGKLKVYIDSLQRHIDSNYHYTHRFWVRGHWRHFNSNYYKAMKGRKAWIPPYVKGEGFLLPKHYLLNRHIDGQSGVVMNPQETTQ